MSLQKKLDYVIKLDELNGMSNSMEGYKTETGFYETYMSNYEWDEFLHDMEKNHADMYEMYKNGGGKELDERKSGNNIYPPKMASYGSSSRMIYNLAKDIEGFVFEEKLSTTVGGIANLDGFIEKDDTYIFVEAKCREPYGTKSSDIEIKYKDLYKYISESPVTLLNCKIIEEKAGKMKVEFLYNGIVIEYFDMKQMICHLLGIATAFLNGKYSDKNIKFLYLLYNPTLIDSPKCKEWDRITGIYEQTCDECNMIDFKVLYSVLFEFLKDKLKISDIQNKSSFTFRLCDRNNFKGEVLC